MKRRSFLKYTGITGSMAASAPLLLSSVDSRAAAQPGLSGSIGQQEISADLVIAGGGMGGCACALAALKNGLRVVMTEETVWIGGQLTQQGVPPDEHRWIETHGATRSYRELRSALRSYYTRNYPLTPEAGARKDLNPGNGAVSRLCIEPRAGVAVLLEMLAPYQSSGMLTLLTETKISKAETDGDKVRALEAVSRRTGDKWVLNAPYFVDATELGDLLPFTGTEYVKGAESRQETGELHAPEKGNPENQQAFTLCFAMDYQPGMDYTIERPVRYDFWRSYVPKLTPPWPGRLLDLTYSKPDTLQPRTLGFNPEGVPTGDTLNLWNYRRIIDRKNFTPGFFNGDITIVNWPQNDYLEGNLIDVDEEQFRKTVDEARELNLSLLYWLQTEVPRPDGGNGWPGLRLRGDVMGSHDGMALYPYIRESRRIKALFTVLEEHVGVENRKLVKGEEAAKKAEDYFDSVGVGFYYLDLHPSTGGDNYIDTPSLPFQIPLGALIPQRIKNLLPANKNIGTTHITNGCYRLHPVEWNIGESVGLLVVYALKYGVRPVEVRESANHLRQFQRMITSFGVETKWPE
ncbi:MAG: FAD-dependent oxidoreductase [Bacteroidota bacterium]